MEEDKKVLTAEIRRAEQRDIRGEVRPIAKRFVKQISLYANNRYKDGARMSAAIALGALEQILIGVARTLHKDDLVGQRNVIESVYDAAKKDALDQLDRP